MSIDSSLNQKEAFIISNVLWVNRVKIAFAQAEVMNSVKNGGFSWAIVSYEAIGSWAELEFGVSVVFKIYNRQIFKYHRASSLEAKVR